jgi:sigma-B regulation protein RsbU (phosphoserine phosphatase)
MALGKTLLRSEALQGYATAEILARVNQALCADNHECMFLTVFCLLLNTRTGQVECCAAGHNPPLLCSSSGMLEFVSTSPGLMLGFEENLHFDTTTISLQPGDTLFLYTDGVTEAENTRQEPFSEARFKNSILERRSRPLDQIVAAVREDIGQFAQGHLQSDDITVLALRYHGS